jgi:2-keto-4-pentenoate hydratase/2-oxohepta-3-ene-1,7-dioic acid hydratase in catechol pathway
MSCSVQPFDGSRGIISGRVALYVALSLIVVSGLALLALRSRSISGVPTIDNPRFEQERPQVDDRLLPSVLRFDSALEGYDGRVCFGLVLETRDGVPVRVLNLTAVRPELGSSLADFTAHDGFELAEQLFDPALRQHYLDLVESFEARPLATVVKPPVDLSIDQLEAEERFVIGVGFNYAAHREETGVSIEAFLFPKFVEPTGAYEPVALGRGIVPAVETARLVDYEAEIGFVLLEEVDLDDPPSDREAFEEKIAFFVANDVSDRRPQIGEGESGYTRAKSRPTYLPIGPWMMHGRHLDLRTRSGGERSMRLWLRVEEAEPHPGGSWRQDSSSAQMIRGPLEIVHMIAELHRESRQRDGAGILRSIVRVDDGRATIPAGSLVLTGTPEGTAIEAPTGWDRARLLARGNLTAQGTRLEFTLHAVRHREEMGFLDVGDTVETCGESLGCQRWIVVP